MEIDIQNDLNNKDLEVGKEQKSFLETTLGGIINTGLNLGIKYLLPDFVEDEVIDLGKSAIGIVTGKFDDISQMQKAVENGGIIDTISKGIDTGINKVNEKGKLNDTISNVIKKGKNLILDNISSNIEEMIVEQGNEINKFETSINEWKKAYENKDFDLMEKEMKNINKYLEKIMPLENIIKEARIVENIHSLIKNNNKNFEINEVELEAANVLS